MNSNNLKVLNFGCRLNSAESEIMYNNLIKSGVSNTVVFNGCSVTAEAERKLKQSIRRERRKNPESKIILTGCPATNRREVFENMRELDVIIDNQSKIEWSRKYLNHNKIQNNQEKYINSKTRICLPIQNGCNHSCTFCLIPSGRGKSRSVEFKDLVMQIKSFSKETKEIILTGIDITAYGADLNKPTNLGILCKNLLDSFPDIPRWRLSSIDSAEIDNDLLELMSYEKRIMPYIHLSIQSGSDLILKRMRRRHLRADLLSLINEIKKRRSDVVFGADMIVGFPTETDEHFQDSLSLLQLAPIHWLHVFPYSSRPNTPASRMPQVNKDIIKLRSRKMRKLSFELVENFALNNIGKSQMVLIEANGRGFTPQYLPIKVDDFQSHDIGSVKNVEFKSWDTLNQVMISKVI